MDKIKQLVDKVVKKNYWLFPKHIEDIRNEAAKRKMSQSALMRHIINNWFTK